eukprot:CAMPEP_0119420340 /NCGR_PEP_ID=MMETSP1335-20130426/23271_1 /TAXON_ID=259385 /ORGANISM="Chrysoculter rhomboideus, Strain RCC1486" /LENGTH=59 /DNA_ID=CAMNT_0007445689 /DNA_START=14 /DNA_END=193 /DNA_ORIENTATION=-
MEGPVIALRHADATPAAESGKSGAESGGEGALEAEVELALMGQPTRVTVDARALASVLE